MTCVAYRVTMILSRGGNRRSYFAGGSIVGWFSCWALGFSHLVRRRLSWLVFSLGSRLRNDSGGGISYRRRGGLVPIATGSRLGSRIKPASLGGAANFITVPFPDVKLQGTVETAVKET